MDSHEANERFLNHFVFNPIFESDSCQRGIYRLARMAGETGLESVMCRIPRPIGKETEKFLFLAMNWTRFELDKGPSAHERELLRKQAFDIRNWIVAANQGLVYDMARKLANHQTQREDLVGDGWFPLMRASELFDADRNYRFSTYATHAIRNHLVRIVKRKLPTQSSTAEGEDLLQNVADSGDFGSSQAERIESLSRDALVAVKDLPVRQRKVLEQYFGLAEGSEAISYTRIADGLGLSKERVRQIAIEGLESIRGQMTGSLQAISG